MFMPFIYGCNYSPVSLADAKEETVTCVGAGYCEELEIFFRNATFKMGYAVKSESERSGREGCV